MELTEKMSVFEEIKAHVAAGQNINEFSNDAAVLYIFLDEYYRCSPCDCDDAENLSNREPSMPLVDRPSGILAKLEWLFAHGADVNAGGEWLPLMQAVGNLDVAMTAYLLDHGADPHYAGEDDGIPYGCGNYYIDDLDIALLDESFVSDPDKSVFDRVLQIAVLFAKHGVTDVHTHCTSIDSKTRTIHISKAKVVW